MPLHRLPAHVGHAFRANATTLPGTFALKSGAPKTYVKTAESGNKRAQAFCPDCGTHVYASDAVDNPQTVGLRVGTLDQRAEFARRARFGSARRCPGRWI